jgi:hypothetical protein
MSHIVREMQPATLQNFVFSDVPNMMIPIGIGVIAKMDIGIMKALITYVITLTPLSISHVAK